MMLFNVESSAIVEVHFSSALHPWIFCISINQFFWIFILFVHVFIHLYLYIYIYTHVKCHSFLFTFFTFYNPTSALCYTWTCTLSWTTFYFWIFPSSIVPFLFNEQMDKNQSINQSINPSINQQSNDWQWLVNKCIKSELQLSLQFAISIFTVHVRKRKMLQMKMIWNEMKQKMKQTQTPWMDDSMFNT